ncbi:ABC transporter ATP-binding protein [Mariniblastus fucicola]|uniref:Daunorubicin/doxorubicin resistance ATP-binding protein DrrA n=1 Tax=Mariniblastus fucicola TaxID=980251 RepID=A0A5B9PJD4_9BACT|nr:ABC transporter ATP-binding protein [Mariniblastus fucicola]QEG22801.1 Daunorubicin/doxorubicin resistance ATP-binding protein DrrA [Mariniblastus fucicola]
MIEAKSLVKTYGTLTAVDNLSLTIHEGETIGLLGPNGAGKTTTIGMLVGLTTPDSGEVVIHKGNNSPQIAPTGSPNNVSVRGRIGIAPQALSLYEELSAVENLRFFGSLYDLAGKALKDRVETALEIAGLEDRRNDRVSTFSGGMKRRLNIAVALIHEPEVILLDEPTVGVDPQSRNHIFERIEQMQKNGMTILYTTHYMEEAQRLCDRVAIMDHGKILAIDTVDGLLEKHGTRPVVSATLHPQSSRAGLPAEPDGDSLRFESDDPITEVSRLTQSGIRFQSLQIANSDLESVFLTLTGRQLRDRQ